MPILHLAKRPDLIEFKASARQVSSNRIVKSVAAPSDVAQQFYNRVFGDIYQSACSTNRVSLDQT